MANQVKHKRQAPPRYSEQQKREVAEAAKSGMSLQELVDKFPMGRRAILRYLRKFDVKLQK